MDFQKKVNSGIDKTFLIALIVLCLLNLGSINALAQAVSGDLVGTITDSSGAVIPNAAVSIENTATGFKATTTSNAQGEYSFKNLVPGNYNITATAKGYGNGNIKNYSLSLNKVGTANLKLAVGTGSTTVDVFESAIAVDTTSAQVQNSYGNQSASILPTASVGLGVLNQSLLSAGVASSGGVGAGSGPSVGGQRPRNNNFTIEGVDVNDKTVTGPLLSVPNDAVQDFTLLQNQFSAEYGHSSGGQFNTAVMSGSNKFHGRAYEYFQNRHLNAVDSLNSPFLGGTGKNDRYDNNRFGGQIGGPVFKNKLFFFTNWEYQPIGAVGGAAGACAPTTAGYATISAKPGIIANNLTVLKTYLPAAASATPATCNPLVVGGSSIPTGSVNFFGPSFNNNLITTNSGDWNISSKDQLRVRYIYQKNTGFDTGANLPAFWITLPVKYHVFTLNEYHTFTSNLNNEFRVGFNRFENNFGVPNITFPGLSVFPNLSFDDLGVNLGPDGNAPQGAIQNTYQFVDNVSWRKGKHDMKFGAEYREYITPQYFTQRVRGDYEWLTTDDYLRDLAPTTFGERSTGSFPYYGNQQAFYIFGNDTWHIRPRLTLSLGLRYELTTVPLSENQQTLNSLASVPGFLVFSKPQKQTTNFAPRIGIAWDPRGDGKTSIRAGFSMAYDVLYDNLGILSRPPELSSTCDVNVGGAPIAPCNYSTTGFLAGGGLPFTSGLQTFPNQAAAAQNSSSYITNQVLPYSESWNLGIQHEFAGKYTLEVRYLGSRGIHLPVQSRLNRQTKTSSTLFLPTFVNAPSQSTIDALSITMSQIAAGSSFVPAYATNNFNGANVVAFEPWGQSRYNSLSTQLDRRFTNGLQFRTAWTWSKNEDNSTADVFSTVLTPRRPSDFQCWSCDMSTSALDRRHRVTFQAIYELPIMKGSNNVFVKHAAHGWTVSPIYTYQSPEYATVRSGVDTNLNGDSAGDRAIFNSAGLNGTGTGVYPLCKSTLPVGVTCGASASNAFFVGYAAIDPTAQYIVAGAGSKSNIARNTLATRRIDNIDMTVSKKFNIREGMFLEFQAQALNMLNHPQYVPGSLNQINSIGYTGGTVTNMLIPGFVVRPTTPNTPSATDVSNATNPGFNKPNLAFSSNPRAMQLVLKFSF